MPRIVSLARDLDIDSIRLREFARDYGYEWPSSLMVLNEHEVEFVRTVAAPALKPNPVPVKIAVALPKDNPFAALNSCQTGSLCPVQDQIESESTTTITGKRFQSYVAELDLAWNLQRDVRGEESRRIYVTTCAVITEAVLAMMREAVEATRIADVSLTQELPNDLAKIVEDFFAMENISYKVPPGIRTALSRISAARNVLIHRRRVSEGSFGADLVQHSHKLHEWINDLSKAFSERKV